MDATRIIISDLHIGANDKFDIFNPAVKLPIFEKFINYAKVKAIPLSSSLTATS